MDGSPTALREAARRMQSANHVVFRRATVPRDMPRGTYDLVIVSELAYYIPAHHLAQLANRIYTMLAPRGAVVVLNHRRPFDDAAVLPALAHRRLRRRFASKMKFVFDAAYRHFDVMALQKPYRGLKRSNVQSV